MFKAPRSGDFSAARVFRYRALEAGADRPRARAVRRWRGGGGGAAGRHRPRDRLDAPRSTTRGTTSALKPVYLPLVHQLVRYLARYEAAAVVADRRPGRRSRRARAQEPRRPRRRHARPASGRRSRRRTTPGLLELNEQGVYEIRADRRRRPAGPMAIAVNLDPAESDLTPLDPRELVAAVTGRADRRRRRSRRRPQR